MTNLRTYVAMSATAAIIAFGQNAFGQDDLDDLLADLEGEAPAAAAPAAAAENKAEEPAAAKTQLKSGTWCIVMASSTTESPKLRRMNSRAQSRSDWWTCPSAFITAEESTNKLTKKLLRCSSAV